MKTTIPEAIRLQKKTDSISNTVNPPFTIIIQKPFPKLSVFLTAFWFLAFAVAAPGTNSLRAQDADSSETAPINFVFYNLKNYLAMERRVDGEVKKDAGKPEKEIAPLMEALLDMQPDILGVCEIGDESYIADLQNRLKKGGIDLPHTAFVRDAAGWNRNLAIFSKYKIVAENSKDKLTYTIGDKVMPFQRGILDVTVMPNPRYRLRLMGLHFKSKREIEEADQALMRLNEARLAREHVDKILEAEPGANLLVFGDLNDTKNENPVRELKGRFGRGDFLTSINVKDKYGFAWTHHWSWADDYSRLDFAMASKGLNPEIIREESKVYHWPDWDKASDHRPLFIKISPVDRAVK